MADDDRFYVKTLTLENFRCFEKAEFGPFDPHFNLLVGENGAGKSTILIALANLFRNLADRAGIYPSDTIIGQSDVRTGTPPNNTLLGSNFQFPSWSMSAVFNWRGDKLGAFEQFYIQNSINGPRLSVFDRGKISYVSDDFRAGSFSARQELILLYDVDRRFRNESSKFVGEPTKSKVGLPYVNWLNAGASASEMVTRLKDKTLESFQAEREGSLSLDDPAIERSIIEKAVAGASDAFRKIEFVQRVADVVIDTSDGRRLAFGAMSSGQRAFIGLIADIAWRAFALNGDQFGGSALDKTTGLVLIDEIDLHLHPKWQRQIVPALKKVFPKIQFFATTHSPQVIGECRPEEIVLLTPQGQKRPSGGYGRDSNWILECVMEAEGRDPAIAARLKDLFDDIEDEKFDAARAKIAGLRKDIGEGPEIVGAEAYLWRMQHLGDEAAE